MHCAYIIIQTKNEEVEKDDEDDYVVVKNHFYWFG